MNAQPPVIVPINLGCCPPHGPRCALCPPSEPVEPDTVAALVAHYADRAEGRTLRPWFFGGAPPTPEQVAALGGLPFGARVRPDLLRGEQARSLQAAGLVEVELDAWTLQDAALREVDRSYRARWVLTQSEGLAQLGLRVGGVLRPGLPRTTHATLLEDTQALTPLWSFVRLHPVLVVAGSALADHHATGRYRPPTLAQALTSLEALVDRWEQAGVPVRRIGQQPGPDDVGTVVAGPVHPGLRELVEGRRALRRVDALLAASEARGRVGIRCASADEARVRGPANAHLRDLRVRYALDDLQVLPDPHLPRGTYRVTPLPPRDEEPS